MSEFLFKKEYDELLAEINKKDVEISISDIKEMWEEILDIKENKLLYADHETQIAELSRLYILEYFYLAMSIGDDISNEVQLILKPLLVGMANTALCIYKNAFDGFKYQAKVLLRNLYEQGLVFLNVLLDKEKRIALLEAARNGSEYQTWRKYFTPKLMHETISNFETKLGDSWSKQWHNRMYSNLSSYVHNDFLSFLTASYYISENEEENMELNVCGGFADRVDITLDQMNGMLFFFGMNFLKIIASDYSDVTKEMICTGENNGSNNQKFWNKAAFLELLNRKCFLEMFWESHLEE